MGRRQVLPAGGAGCSIQLVIERVLSCSCGAVRVSTTGEPSRVSACHCLACQRRTGSAFGVGARFEAAQVRVEGTARTYTRVADSGGRVVHRFCPECGGTVCWTAEALPGVVLVPVGAYLEPVEWTLAVSIYEDRKVPWVDLRAAQHLE